MNSPNENLCEVLSSIHRDLSEGFYIPTIALTPTRTRTWKRDYQMGIWGAQFVNTEQCHAGDLIAGIMNDGTSGLIMRKRSSILD